MARGVAQLSAWGDDIPLAVLSGRPHLLYELLKAFCPGDSSDRFAGARVSFFGTSLKMNCKRGIC